MLLCHLAVPCELSTSIGVVLKALATVSLQTFDWIPVNPSSPLAKTMEARKHPHSIFISECPTDEFLAAMAEAGAPMLASLDMPAVSASILQRQRKLDRLTSTRHVARCFSTMHDVLISPNVGIFPLSAVDQPLDAVALEIANFFGLNLPPDWREAIKKHLPPAALAPGATLASVTPRPAAPVDGVDVALAEKVLAGFEPLLAKQPAGPFVWPADFLLGEPKGDPIKAPVVLTGMRRCFAYGPFSYLPKGKWRAVIDFTVSENYSGNLLKAEIFSNAVIALGEVRLPTFGRFSFGLDFEVTDPHLSLQVRLFNWEGAIEGIFEIHDTRVERC